ncbi:MATE family efflux transporter [Vibrio ulleungensis]|uniref:Multidrug resistance protein NorM n=1 Tax=Vibrio ulleungensis TaxID=2807619 RepID=A0ABS2HGE7_9VIBR|nr:MATE family efflux transporter [Vibrio ulleungensis]MBM7036129.1 MATE family efflux transporter [Vibrio ulleungensis]
MNDSPLLNKPVGQTLRTMAIPAAFGMLMTFMFQLVDTYFIGMLGVDQLAAMSFSFPVYILIVSFFMGTAAGVSSTVGRALGANNPPKAQRLVGVAMTSFMIITVVIGMLGLYVDNGLFSLLGAKQEALFYVKQYMTPLFLGMFLLVGGLIANSALMAKGIMIPSTAVMVLGGIVNVVFDYLLIFGHGPFPTLGLQGAAVATVLSWLTILVLMTALLYRAELLSFSFLGNLKQASEDFSQIMLISTPAIAAQVLNPIAIAVITRSVSQYGDNAVAAFGIVSRIESLALVGILALSVILTPFIAQNVGAKANHRVNQSIAISGRITVYWGIGVFLMLALFSAYIFNPFSQNPTLTTIGQNYFYIVGLTYPAFGLALITSSIFNGAQLPKRSMAITMVKSIILTIPMVLFAAQFSLESIWIGIALANILGALYARKQLIQWQKQSGDSTPNSMIVKDYINDFGQLRWY